jgi:hypothetical protein
MWFFESISSNPTINPATPLIEIPSPSNNEFFVKQPAEQAFFNAINQSKARSNVRGSLLGAS